MSNYIKNTNFTAKDNLTSGDPAKVIKGAEFDTEFNALQTAVNSKADSNNSQLTGTTDAQAVETTGDVTVGGNLSVTGNATISGNLTFGNADTDTVSFSADVNSNIIPDADSTYDLGSSSKEWRNLYLDGTAFVDGINLNGVNVSATASELNVLDGITASTAELNILDGITSTTTELNKLDGFTGSATDLNYAKDLRDTGVTTTEFNKLDGLTATTTELNYTDGVTSNIQTQLNAKAASNASPTITLSGDVSGSATLTNLGNATITATIADDSHNHTIANVDGLQTSLDSKAPTASPTFTGTATIPTADVTDLDVDAVELKAIAESKAVTAVDVFVYDTRKDSDGGAWRKRTQGTSWYNEPLNTSTRGSRKEFPAVAVIVAEYSASPTNTRVITIYDGDDPSLPMWMTFIRDGGVGAGVARKMIPGVADARSVTALNGVLSLASSETNRGGAHTVSFLKDSGFHYSGTGLSGTNGASIANRNVSYPSIGDNSKGNVVSNLANDIAMTVLPDAPIDPDTGLPIPTIAVATGGGVSVIKDDGTVVDSLVTANMSNLKFTSDGLFYQKDSGTAIVYFATFSDITSGDGFGDGLLGQSIGSFAVDVLTRPTESAGAGDTIIFGGRVDGTGVKNGVALHDLNNSDYAKSISSLITSTYNTGWMNGDIKLATLSDTDDTDLVATELVTNGTFDTDVSGWSADSDGSIISWNNSGAIDVDRNNSGFSSGKFTAQYSVNGLEIGKDYTISADVLALSNYVSLSITNDNYSVIAESQEINTTGAINLTFKATTTSAIIGLGARLSLTATATFDNVSVRLAEPDRSVNGNGLQVFGTVQKNPVATGADLVAYSTLGNVNNYLKGADDLIDYTQDWFVSMWSPTGQFTYSLWDDDNATQVAYDQLVSSLFTVGGGNIFYRSNHYSFDFGSARPKHIAIKHVSGEGLYFYLDGVLHTSTTSTNTTISSARVYIGRRSYDGNPSSGGNCNMSLFRISGTAPTAEQVAKIYRDEKPLFQEGAQATLHGTSDAVTALAYDDSTDLLHVGTSAGRSVFKGLQRVDNTTDAVGTAISASDNFIAEE
jgi:hypothetical protein